MAVTIIQGLCIGCGVCTQMCPSGALYVQVKTAHVNAKMCTECEECVFACPNGAITL
jgi:NAD-dependent dihydropyrimidine dehydrogenase PreA subunit